MLENATPPSVSPIAPTLAASHPRIRRRDVSPAAKNAKASAANSRTNGIAITCGCMSPKMKLNAGNS